MREHPHKRRPVIGFRLLGSGAWASYLRYQSLLLLIVGAMSATGALSQTLVKPAQYLANLPKPQFAAGHTLPHLGRWGYVVATNTQVELALNWGFCLYVDITDMGGVLNPASAANFYLRLASNNPAQFKLSVAMNRSYPQPIPDSFWCRNPDGFFVDGSSNTWQSATNTTYTKVVSPEGPDEYWQYASEWQVNQLKIVRSNAPITMILNGGETGLNVPGAVGKAWNYDPVVVAKRGMLPVRRYASDRKAHQLNFVTEAIRREFPERELYIYYGASSEQERRQRWNAVWDDYYLWGFNADVMTRNTDLPSFEFYVTYQRSPNCWTNASMQSYDLLTGNLNAVGYHLRLGRTNHYDWVSGGWGVSSNCYAEIPRYTGFLKCLYTSGMLGAVAFHDDDALNGGLDATFPENTPPHWLQQLVALSRVHAQFSHLEGYLRNGDLLPSTNTHAMSADQPAYEFATGVPYTRVLARKDRASSKWLITAWAAHGPDRVVNVNIPPLGSLSLLARDCGSVYEATSTSLELLDRNGMYPTERWDVPGPTNVRAVGVP